MVDAVHMRMIAVIRGPRCHALPLDAELLERTVHVAREARLRAYDAMYVALAPAWNERILTLDDEVVERAVAHFGDLRVFGAG